MKKSLGLAMLLLASTGTSFAMLSGKLTKEREKLLRDDGFDSADYSNKLKKFMNLTNKISLGDIKLLEAMSFDFKSGRNRGSKSYNEIKKSSEVLINSNIGFKKTTIEDLKQKNETIKKVIAIIKKTIQETESKLKQIQIRQYAGETLEDQKQRLIDNKFDTADFMDQIKMFGNLTKKISVEDIKLLDTMYTWFLLKGRSEPVTRAAFKAAKSKLNSIIIGAWALL